MMLRIFYIAGIVFIFANKSAEAACGGNLTALECIEKSMEELKSELSATRDLKQRVDELESQVVYLHNNSVGRCKIEVQSGWSAYKDDGGKPSPEQKNDNFLGCEAGKRESSFTPVGGGASDWTGWAVSSDWDGEPWACIRARIVCE